MEHDRIERFEDREEFDGLNYFLPPPISFFKTLLINCLYRLRVNLTRRLNEGRRLLSIRSMTLGDASRAAKNSARLGWGLVMDDRPPLYFDATSIDDSFFVTLLQSSA